MRLDGIAANRPAGPVSLLTALAGGSDEVDNLRAFWRRVERVPAGSELRLSDEAASREVVIVSGWACELRILSDGRRQIFSILLPGDLVEARSTTGPAARHVVALTRLEVVDAQSPVSGEVASCETVWAALTASAIRREERLYDHLLRLGCLTAKERVVHLLLDLLERLEGVGLAKGDSFRIPLTQELFADALGLSVVHMNRTFKQLRQDDLVTVKSGVATLRDRPRLMALARYQPSGAWARGQPHEPGAQLVA